FFQNGNSLGATTLQFDGTARLATTSLPTGSLSITAQYSGDSVYSGSTSAPITQAVNPAGTEATTTSLSSSSMTPAPGESVTLTATVAPVSSDATPTGNVSFFDNGTSIGQAELVNGVGQLAFTF